MSLIDRYEDQLLAAATLRHDRAARRRRLRLPAIGLGGMLAVAGGAAAFLLTPAGNGLTPVQSALAALAQPGEILHFDLEQFYQQDGQPELSCRATHPTEIWTTTSGEQQMRVLSYPVVGANCGTELGSIADGTPAYGPIETEWGKGIHFQYLPTLGHATEIRDPKVDRFGITLAPGDGSFIDKSGTAKDPQAELRTLLASPQLRDEGISVQDGRRVRTFSVPAPPFDDDGGRYPRPPHPGRFVYTVDAQTWAPVSVVSDAWENIALHPDRAEKFVHVRRGLRITDWQRLPRTDENERLLHLQLPADVTVTRGDSDFFYRSSRALRVQMQKQGQARLDAYLKAHPEATPQRP